MKDWALQHYWLAFTLAVLTLLVIDGTVRGFCKAMSFAFSRHCHSCTCRQEGEDSHHDGDDEED
jgi:hypothetical protein